MKQNGTRTRFEKQIDYKIQSSVKNDTNDTNIKAYIKENDPQAIKKFKVKVII